MTLAQELVAAGAAFLDGKLPDWYEQIDVGSLNMADECQCVLGRLGGNRVNLDHLGWDHEPLAFCDMLEVLGLDGDDAEQFGFDVTADVENRVVTYEDLHRAWVWEIDARRVRSIV